MSRRWAALGGAVTLFAIPAAAQDTGASRYYGPFDLSETESDPEDGELRKQAKPCDTEPTEDGVILVCRELEEEERYRDPLPAPVASDRVIISGIETPPCWVQPRNDGMVNVCVRMGWAPEPVLMVDVTQFPEKLSDAHLAAIVVANAIVDDAGTAQATGQRVPIDISED